MLTTTASPDVSFFDDLRRCEFRRLDAAGHAYLDYTGSALYGSSQLAAHHALLADGLFGNPHSEHTPSRASAELIESARASVRSFFDADGDEYDVCFTANTSAAVKLIGESYAFGPRRSLVLSADNHNSINGLREFARRARARVRLLTLDADLRMADSSAVLNEAARDGGGLVAFPALSNFSGVKHPLSLISDAQSRGFDVLLDAAAFVPANALSLRVHPADFVVLSFYKLFGYPTGVGALVVRREALARLTRPWFAGGTVNFASVLADTYQRRDGHEGFEDGTPNFLAIAALDPGFALLARVGMTRLTSHVAALADGLRAGLAQLRHPNGAPLARVYGPSSGADRGGTLAFNVLDEDEHPVAFEQVERRARDARVSMRGGCFCNPGAAEAAFGYEAGRLSACLASNRRAFTMDHLRGCLGDDAAVGAVRASLGLANNAEDVRRAVDVVASFAGVGTTSLR